MLPTPFPPEPLTPDADLLRRYAADRDQAAFELLVWRYARLVSGVCRRVLRHRHDAEDAAQAAFLVLARRADTVQSAVGGWLAKVAYRCALQLANRRCEPPRDLLSPSPLGGRGVKGEGERTDPELAALLDAELNRLPDRYRLPLVLCCLHGLSYQQAAAELNCKPGTLSVRLSRAKAVLRGRLLARGVGVSVAAFAAFLSDLARGSPEPARELLTARPAAAGVATGVHRAMTAHTVARRSMAVAFAAVLLLAGGTAATRLFADDPKPVAKPADPPKEKKGDKELLQGDWVFDSAEESGGGNAINQAWQSVVTFDGDKLTVTKYRGLDWNVTFAADAGESPKRLDMTVTELAKKVLGFKDGTLKGIYKLDGDTLELCLADTPDAPRPTEFTTGPKLKQFRFTLKRKAKAFDPAKVEAVTVKVVDGDGKPVEGAVVCQTAYHYTASQKADEWTYSYPNHAKLRTDASGELTLPTGGAESQLYMTGVLYLRHERRKLAALEPLSPARIMRGVTLTLRPEAKLSGAVTFPNGVNPGPTGVYLCTNTNLYLLGYFSADGLFEFPVPAGEYRVLVRGDYVSEEMTPGESSYPALSNTVPVTVGIEGKELKLEVKPSKVGALRGKDAPDLGEMAEWRGKEVKLADLKGKVVLVKFFNAGEMTDIVHSMPSLAELHTHYANDGLVVVGVHYPDAYNEQVTTVKQLDKRFDAIRTDKWPKDIPFPIALMKTQKDAAAKAYSLNTDAILIDKKGKVVGLYRPYVAGDLARLEKLLNEK